MIMRSFLGRARGLGSSKDGVHHWWMQRLTAVGLVPLSLWFVIATIRFGVGADYAGFKAWLSGNLSCSALMLLFVLTALYHAQLGLVVVIEDYVHCKGKKFAAIMGVKFLAALLSAIAVVSILKLAVGA